MLAQRYNWTQQETDAQDAEFVDELLVFLQAEDEEERADKKARERSERLDKYRANHLG